MGCSDLTKILAVIDGLMLVVVALAPSITTLAIALFIFGAAHGSMDVTMNAWAGEVERHLKKPVMNSFHGMWSVGAGLGAATGYFAVNLEASPQVHFMIAALLALALALPFGLMPWTSERREKVEGEPIYPLPKGALAVAGIITFCAALGEGAMADWSAIFLIDVAEVDEAKAALGFAVFSCAMVFMRFTADQVIMRTGPVLVARVGGVVAGLGTLLAVLVGNYYVILAGFMLMGLGFSVVFPLAFSRATNDGNLAPGAAIASVATLGYGGMLLGPVIIGFIAEASSIRMSFAVVAALSFLIVALAKVLAIPNRDIKT